MSSSQRASRSPGDSTSQRESGGPSAYEPPELANLPTSVSPSQLSPSMIGPPPSFYDPNQAVTPEGLDYHQWMMANGYGPGPAQAQASGNVPFQQPSQLHHVSPAPNQYTFVQQEQYGPEPYDSHIVHQAQTADRLQRALPTSRRGGGVNYPAAPPLRMPTGPPGAYQQSQQSPPQQQQPFELQSPAGTEGYYYQDAPLQAPQHQQQPPQQQPQQQQRAPHSSYNFVGYQPDQYTTPTYTPGSDFTNLPSSGSTPSQGPPSAHPQTQQQQPLASSSRHASGSGAARGRGRGVKTTKRPRVDDSQDGGDSDSGSDSEPLQNTTGFSTVSVPPPQGQGSLPTRLPGACKHCKKLKMRCEFPPDDNTCKRCKSGGHQCIVEGRKPRNAPNKREYLLAQIRQKNAIIESLLKQIHNPYLATPMSIASYRMATSPTDQNNQNVLAWLDRLQASVQAAGTAGGLSAFKMDVRADGPSDDSEEDGADGAGGEPTERGSVGHGQPEDDEPLKDAEDRPTALPNEAVPIGLLANLALDNKSKRKKKVSAKPKDNESSDDDVGVACETFFDPGPAFNLGLRATMIESVSPPEILVHGLVTPDDVEKLFKIFFEKVNPHCDVLDPILHTPASTFARCPFLFTVVCAISSRYYTEKSEIYPIAMHFAKHAAASALLNGWKSVELSQAYILMSLYGVPARRWEEDRNWLYTGLAIRIATDLNLHVVSNVKPKTEKQEREMINQTRVWLLCFNLDRSTASQFGKPSTIKEDYTIRHSNDWYKSSRMNSPLNIGTSAYAQLLRVVSRFHEAIYSDPESPTGLNQHLDFRSVILEHDEQLTVFFNEWMDRFQRDSDMTDPVLKFRAELLPFLTAYSRLVMYSFGFQQAFKRGFQPEDHMFLEKCYELATTVITILVDSLIPTGYMSTSPDGYFVFASFASAFLLKLLRPEFSGFVPRERQQAIFDLISRLIDKLGSPDVAIDERHTPALHSRFLHGLLRKHRRDLAVSSRPSDAHGPPSQPQPQASNRGAAPGSANSNTSTTAFQQSQASASQYGGLGSAGAGGAPYNNITASIAGSSPAAFSDSSFTLGGLSPSSSSPVFETEPSYMAVNGNGHVNGHDAAGMFQFGAQSDENWGALLALQNPNYWKDMMMPGFTWPESPSSMQEHTMTNGFDTSFGYQMAAPLSG
ncbi:hypothetical protein V8D89_000486 [Ganoderma adspersum]